MKKLADIDNHSEEQQLDINLSPLIDMVFLLLIFFMVTAVFVENNGVEVSRPSAKTASQLSNDNLVITVDEHGSFFFKTQSFNAEELKQALIDSLNNGKLPAVIIADGKLATSGLVKAIDICKLAGIEKISLATEKAD